MALEPDTVLFAGHVLVFTTLTEVEFEPILDWYRLRWQIESVFKRFKQIAQLGYLPKNDPQSATAWLYDDRRLATTGARPFGIFQRGGQPLGTAPL